MLQMSLTIQQIILDAKRLANRLKEHDSAADALLSQTQSVYKQIDAMKQYQEEVGELNETARQRPHTVLVAGIQQENRHLRELQQENRELRAALEEHQNALELIMSKYRQQVTKLVSSTVMERAAETDDKNAFDEQELVSKLTTENKGLRELLEISCKFGSLRTLLKIEAEDKGSQTEAIEDAS
ncbi:FGFR1 oncogene partner 2 [Blattella germanica]|nr:FGFR1 oncogene partner 2 [Blattella germanica]